MSTKKTLDDLKKQLQSDEQNESSNVPFIPEIIQPVEEQELTDKQLKFIDEYMVDLNGSQAAIRTGSTEASARVTAHRMLTNNNIKQEIRRRQQEEIIRNGIKRADTYKMLLDTINEINTRLTMDLDGEFNGLITARLKTIDMLNKMGGFYQDINITQNNFNGEIKINIVKPNGY